MELLNSNNKVPEKNENENQEEEEKDEEEDELEKYMKANDLVVKSEDREIIIEKIK